MLFVHCKLAVVRLVWRKIGEKSGGFVLFCLYLCDFSSRSQKRYD